MLMRVSCCVRLNVMCGFLSFVIRPIASVGFGAGSSCLLIFQPLFFTLQISIDFSFLVHISDLSFLFDEMLRVKCGVNPLFEII